MKPMGLASWDGKNALGAVSPNTTVSGAVAVTDAISATFGAQVQWVAGSFSRVKWVTTASALNGPPSVKVTPLRRVKVHVFRSALLVHFVARTPSYLPSL